MREIAFVIASLSLVAGSLPGCQVLEPPPRRAAGKAAGENISAWQNCADPSLFKAGNRCDGATVGDEFIDDVLPIFGQRCATCHGCADSPCQLKLTSYEGLIRGASSYNLFDVGLGGSDPSRLSDGRVVNHDGTIDYIETQKNWEEHDQAFYSVVAPWEGETQSAMKRLLEHAQDKRDDDTEAYRTKQFELFEETLATRTFACFGSDEKQRAERWADDAFVEARAMPFALPALDDTPGPDGVSEHERLVSWLDSWSPGDGVDDNGSAPSAAAQKKLNRPAAAVQAWEDFFNGAMPGATTDEQRILVGRYLYEHMFFAMLAFPEAPGEFYQLVRADSQTGAIREVRTPTGRPNDFIDGEYFYRLRKYTALPVRKAHMSWELPAEKRKAWSELFFGVRWPRRVEYDPRSENPFNYFAAIPGVARARWMLQNSYQMVDAMVRAEVCTGSSATFAIRDRFWVFFLKPESDASIGRDEAESKFLVEAFKKVVGIDLADGDPNDALLTKELAYRKQIEASFAQADHPIGIDDIWTGDGELADNDKNAMLTVMRHGKSATVQRGAVNGYPKQGMWVLTYSNFERLYYNLAVLFKTWGNGLHKALVWRLMSYIRAEGESHFISLLPGQADGNSPIRQKVHDSWISDWTVAEKELWSGQRPTGVPTAQISEDSPVLDLTRLILARLGSEITGLSADDLRSGTDALNSFKGEDSLELPEAIANRHEWEAALAQLTQRETAQAQLAPNATVVRVRKGNALNEDGSIDDEKLVGVYTLIANRYYTDHGNIWQGGDNSREPQYDTLSVVRGVATNYPELFVDVPLASAAEFLGRVAAVESTADFQQLMDDFAASPGESGKAQIIGRNSPQFWPFFDWLHRWTARQDPVGAGILDVSEYIFRDGDRMQ